MARSAIGLPDIKIQRDYLLDTFVTQMYIRLVHINNTTGNYNVNANS